MDLFVYDFNVTDMPVKHETRGETLHHGPKPTHRYTEDDFDVDLDFIVIVKPKVKKVIEFFQHQAKNLNDEFFEHQ